MIPAVGDEISELERTWEIVVKKHVLRLSDLVKVSQWRLEFGFSFPVEKCIFCPTLLSQNACFDFWRREMEGRWNSLASLPGGMISEIPLLWYLWLITAVTSLKCNRFYFCISCSSHQSGVLKVLLLIVGK